MNSKDKLERRIAHLENMIVKESLESRVAKLEKMLIEEDGSQPKSSEDYLMILLNMLFKSRKVNPDGNKLEDNYKFYKAGQYPAVKVLNRAIGDWELNSVTDRGYNIVDSSTDPNDMDFHDVIPIPGSPSEYIHPRGRGQSSYREYDKYKLTNEAEIKKIIGAFCKINKCIVNFINFNIDNKPLLQFVLKSSPTLYLQKRYGDDDHEWETLADQERRHNSLYHKGSSRNRFYR